MTHNENKEKSNHKQNFFILLFFLLVGVTIHLSFKIADLTEELILMDDALAKSLIKNVTDSLECDIVEKEITPKITKKPRKKVNPNII